MSDYQLGDTLYFNFTTRSFSTGVPTTLAGTPVISIYEDSLVTQITAGITLTVDFDAVTGLNNVAVVATSGNGFESGKFYSLVITTGTVGGVSVVGETVGSFSIESSAAALEIGTAGAGLANIGTIATVTNLTNLPSIPANWLTSAGIAASALDGKGDWNIGKTGYTLTQSFPSNFADLSISLTTGLVDITQTAADKSWSTSSRALTDKAGFSISGTKTTLDALNDVAATDIVSSGAITTAAGAVSSVTTVATTTTNTDMRGTDSALLAASYTAPDNAGIYANGTAIAALNDISVADILTTQMTESYSADGAAPTVTQSLMLIQQMLGDFTISGTTLTVKKVDGAATAATFTLNDATSPTGTTRAT